jgi:hypothetical protein
VETLCGGCQTLAQTRSFPVRHGGLSCSFLKPFFIFHYLFFMRVSTRTERVYVQQRTLNTLVPLVQLKNKK